MPTYAKYSGLTGPVTFFPILAPNGTASAPSYSFLSSPQTGMFSSGLNTLNFSTSGTERMCITSGGQVLAGSNFNTARTTMFGTTFTPSFQMEGIDNQTANLSVVQNSNAQATSWGLSLTKTRATTRGGNALVADGDALGGIFFNGSTSTNSRTAAFIQAFVQGTPSDSAMPGRLSFFTNFGTTNASEAMRIDSNGVILCGDFVQQLFTVGTIRPRLIINGAAQNSSSMGMVCTANSTLDPVIYLGKSRGASTAANSGDALGSLNFQVFDGTNMRQAAQIRALTSGTISPTSAPGVLTFSTVPDGSLTQSERMRIDDAGNVGIGTTTPANKLDVSFSVAGNNNSGINITNLNSSGWGGSLSFFHRSGTGEPVLVRSQISSEGGATNSFMRFFTTLANSMTEKMRIDGSGNVGIGTTAPATQLHLSANIANAELIDSYNSTGSTGSSLIFRAARGTAASPTASQLNDPIGAIAARGYGDTTFASTNRASVSLLAAENWTNTAQGTIITLSTTPTGSTTQTERMRIDSAGNVGVKATTFGTSAAAAFGIANGTEPSTSIADQIVMGSVDLTAGNTIPYVRSEGTGMTGAGITNVTVTHKIAIKVNGTVYYLLATTNGT